MNCSNVLFRFLVFAFLGLLSNKLIAQTINNNKITIYLSDSLKTSNINTDDSVKHLPLYGIKTSSVKCISTIQSDAIKIPLEKTGSFIGCGLIMNHAEYSGSFLVEIRNSHDSVTWSNWEVLEQTDLIEKERGTYRSNLLFLDKTARYVQFQITMEKLNDNFPSISDVSLFFTSPLEADKKKTNQVSEIVQIPPYSESFERPLYVNRKGWACPQPEDTISRELISVSHLIIHHSAGNTNSSNYAMVVLAYWDYHVNGNGWDDIGYNWLIDPNGVIYKGRAWYDPVQENVKGAHNSGKNNGTSGVCMIGNYLDGVLPTFEMWNSTYDVLAFLCDKFGLDPHGFTYHEAIERDNDVISGHKDSGGGTACPGDIANSYPAIRLAVAEKLSGSYVPGPVNMNAADCSGENVNFTWTNSGTGWQIQLSTDPSFETYYVKWVSNLSSYIGPNGFVLAPMEQEAFGEFMEGTKYYWRIYYDGKASVTNTFTFHSCSSSSITAHNLSPVFSIYPNPVRGSFTIEMINEKEQPRELEILNTLGKKVFYATFNSSTYEINDLDLPAGLYILRVIENDLIVTRKVVFERYLKH